MQTYKTYKPISHSLEIISLVVCQRPLKKDKLMHSNSMITSPLDARRFPFGAVFPWGSVACSSKTYLIPTPPSHELPEPSRLPTVMEGFGWKILSSLSSILLTISPSKSEYIPWNHHEPQQRCSYRFPASHCTDNWAQLSGQIHKRTNARREMSFLGLEYSKPNTAWNCIDLQSVWVAKKTLPK